MMRGEIRDEIRRLKIERRNVLKEMDLYDENDKMLWDKLYEIQNKIDELEKQSSDFVRDILKKLF